MSDLYDKVAKLDRSIADRWKARSKDKPEYKLQGADIDAIVGPLVKSGTVTENQVKAIVVLVQGSKYGSVEAIRNRLRYYVQLMENRLLLPMEPLVGSALAPVFDALSASTVSMISFTSPKTGVSYAPFDYLAIRKLIDASKLIVAEVRVNGLGALVKLQGQYYSNRNILLFYEGLAPKERTATLVHEVTHVIQDFRDARANAIHFEADAYIAENVSRRASNTKHDDADEIDEAAYGAAKFVTERKAGGNDKEWLTAYDAVTNAVKKSDVYKSKAGLWIDKKKDEKESELSLLQAAVKELEKSQQAFQEWAKDALDTTFIAPLRRVKELIP